MELTMESLLVYQGLNGMDGLCHVRLYEQPGGLPVVIAGQLEDNPGTMLDNAIEMVAAAVQSAVFEDGREFRLVRYCPPGRVFGGPRFSLVEFRHRRVEEDQSDVSHSTGQVLIENDEGEVFELARGAPKQGGFRDPRWTAIEDIGEFVGAEVKIFPAGEYTAGALFGEEGERLRAELAANARAVGDALMQMLREDS